MEYLSELYSILFGAFISFVALMSVMYLPESIETNSFALNTEQTDLQGLSFFQTIKSKFKVICENLKEPLNKKFYLFLITQGLIMPSFTDFEYFFAVDVLKISKFAINLSTIFGAVSIFLLPVFYQRYLAKKEFLISFYLSQIIYLIAFCLTLCLAL